MKNMFGYNINDDENNNIPDGHVFLRNTLPPTLANTLGEALELLKEAEKRLELPHWAQLIRFVSGILTVFVGVGIFNALSSDITLEQGYKNAPFLFYALIIFFLVWLALRGKTGLIKRNAERNKEYKQAADYANSVISSSREAFNIPANAEEIDVLSFKYKTRKEKMKIVSNALFSHVNSSCMIYVQDNLLHMVFLDEEWVVPLHSITGIKKVRKKIRVPNWNKETPFNAGRYKQYKITAYSGSIYFKLYYTISIDRDGEDYELFIPPYELDIVSSLIGLTVKK